MGLVVYEGTCIFNRKFRNMERSWTVFGIIFAISASILGSIPVVSSLECEYYNSTECAASKDGHCEQSRRRISCDRDEPSKVHSCYTLWQKFENLDEDIITFKGCFLNDKQCERKEKCISQNYGKRDDKTRSNTLYCCCDKDFCNREFTWDPLPTTTVRPKEAIPPKPASTSIIVFTLVPVACVAILAVAYFLHGRILKKPLPESQLGYSDEENILLDKPDNGHSPVVTLLEVKASGRFGSVWKASMQFGDKMTGKPSYVAVKILPLRERASWKLEQDVYALNFMNEYEWILQFIEARIPQDGDNFQLWLITEYLERGSLYDYLKGNTLKWSELYTIAVSMCQGLAFLHEEIDRGPRGHKPAVAHRDFKSKNVLLRPDLTACIADFGLAHIFYPTKPVGNSYGQVGTRRYMAPEILEGAVSFTRDNFQRVDMYACGLVLWELASRCIYDKKPVGEYRLPFEEFIGLQPTFEEMQEIVVTQRTRPTVQQDWYTHPGMCVMAEAMKDAWDQDAEARISASCIVERLSAITNKLSVIT